MGLTTKLAAIVLGVVFLIVGGLGYVPNPIVGESGIFVVNPMHNLVHLLTGAVLLIGGLVNLGGIVLKVLGLVYLAVAVLGFVMTGDMLLGLIQLNDADRYLHVALAAVLLLAGFALPGEAATKAAA
jgi:hypothetical protein